MTVTIRLEGSDQLQRQLRRLSDDLREEAGNVVKAVGIEMRADIVKSLDDGPASGRTYTHYFYTNKNGKLVQGRKRAKPHTASAPGQPPMSDTGYLANRITFDRLGDLTAVVGTKVDYALHLEYGTERMAARPFFRPAVERMRPIYIGKLEDIIRRAAR
jgi:HK97 gp10 family phage protein